MITDDGVAMKRIRRNGDKYVLDTGQSPRGFRGVVHIVWTGTPLREEAMSVERLARLPIVDADDVDDEWYDLLVARKLMPKREVDDSDAEETTIESARRTEDERFGDFESHMAAGLDIVTSMAGSGWGLVDHAPEANRDFEWPCDAMEWIGFVTTFVIIFVLPALLALVWG